VSCASPGNCTAVGDYGNVQHPQGLLLTETSGVWAPGVEAVPPDNADSNNPRVILTSVSCASAGNCTAVGIYRATGSTAMQGLLLTQTSGIWAKGVQASLPGGPEPDADFELNSVSCASAGNCTAVGDVSFGTTTGGVFVTQTSGVWADVEPAIPPVSFEVTNLSSVSCASAGNCTAVGEAFNGNGGGSMDQLFTQSSGAWAPGVGAVLPADAATNPIVTSPSVSCASAGNCTAVGDYKDGSGTSQGVLLTQTSGTWATGVKVGLPDTGASLQDSPPWCHARRWVTARPSAPTSTARPGPALRTQTQSVRASARGCC
jgi:hypothetical protein